MAGCGGYCGGLLNQSPIFLEGLKRGYATIVTDTGHWSPNALDGRWAQYNPQAKVDFAWRGVNETVRVGKVLTKAYYKKDIRYSYYNGCSNGGRQGLMEASKFPNDFDGVLSTAPAQNIKGLMAFFQNILAADKSRVGQPILDPAKVPLIREAVAKACGDKRGLVNDPKQCNFKPETLACHGKDTKNCLTQDEIAVVRRWHAPPQTKSGTILLEGGVPYGSEGNWILPDASGKLALLPHLKAGAEAAIRYIYTEPALGDTYPTEGFDFDADGAKIERWAQMMTPSADLSAFRDHKGKLMIVQGWADQMVPPEATIAYYERIEGALGGQSAQDTARLFMVPGMGHCGNVPGVEVPGFDIGDYDALTALEGWVEKGVAPIQIRAEKRDLAGKALWSRPLCAYPTKARYKGTGNADDAANWSCVAE